MKRVGANWRCFGSANASPADPSSAVIIISVVGSRFLRQPFDSLPKNTLGLVRYRDRGCSAAVTVASELDFAPESVSDERV